LAQAATDGGVGDEEMLDETADEILAETLVLTAPRGSQAHDLGQKFEAFVARLQPEPQATLRHYVRWLESLIGDDPALAPTRQPWQSGNSLGVVNQARYDLDGGSLPTAERDVAALQRLKDVLRSLVLSATLKTGFAESATSQSLNLPVANLQSLISYPYFWQELRGAVEAVAYRLPPPKERSAILAAAAPAARGLSFAAAALLGLSEGEFPRQPPRDPLLRESDREMLAMRGAALENQDARDESTLFYETVTRARRQFLATRAYLADDGQPWEPSPYWRQLERHSQAEPVRIRAADALPPSDAASEAELLTALAAIGKGAAADYLPENAVLYADWQQALAGAATLAARMADQPHGLYEGDLSHLAAQLTRRYGPERPWSASRLESYAVCGFAFFACYALGFDPRQPETAGYDVRQLGNMYHAILEETYRQTAETGESTSDVLPEIARQEFDAAPEKYGFRPTPLWQRQREELAGILLNTVKALDAASAGWRPAKMEPPFGLQDAPPLELTDDAGQTLRLRGYIDRVDVDEDGRLRIVDYKSSHTPIAAKALAEGKRIQLALYALAARDALGLGKPAAGMYWHIGSAKSSYLQLEKQDDGIEAGLETAKEYALAYAAAIRQGHFAPHPPEKGCPAWCPAADFCWRYSPQHW
ncbi:MAG: PD-(D/E)XK nuclease family protein, partial [Anaerolineae bacterium]